MAEKMGGVMTERFGGLLRLQAAGRHEELHLAAVVGPNWQQFLGPADAAVT